MSGSEAATKATTLYVTNLPGDVALEDVQRFFSDAAGFLSSRLRRTRLSGQMLAFVEFATEEDAKAALERFHEAEFMDSKGRAARLVVEFAKAPGGNASRVPGVKRRLGSESPPRERSARDPSRSSGPAFGCGVNERRGSRDSGGLAARRDSGHRAGSPEEGARPYHARNGSRFPYGRATDLRFSEGPLPDGASRILFVGNLPQSITERELSHVFRPFAGYESLRVARAGDRFVGFVTFETKACATVAFWNVHGYPLDERSASDSGLRIEYSKPTGPGDRRSHKRVRREHPDYVVDSDA